jgi:hypothetical protein
MVPNQPQIEAAAEAIRTADTLLGEGLTWCGAGRNFMRASNPSNTWLILPHPPFGYQGLPASDLQFLSSYRS